ncbi:serine hydrolase [Deinococcus malanensis]|uniref:Serine hydrolase n=1 Tax=Deinococcus malanensis TaxID=1706855 RepID=A0ABQ2F1Y9_9DEIO|nr:serine hydrolase domain-containing protein [Deinococcus malanensis]GGK40068.1 serine hydrolase [Deinococcus malanensis]
MSHQFTTPPDLATDLTAISQEYRLPGLAWAVSPVDGPVLAGATGQQRTDRQAKVTVHDRLHLGSCTKPMTASMLATLIPDRLQWDLRLADVFPPGEIHEAYHDATLAYLLAHYAGLPPFDEDHQFLAAPEPRGSQAQQRDTFARWALKQEPAVLPGTYLYSNAGVGVAAVVAERITGRTWEELMHERLFAPLELPSAGFGWPGRTHTAEPWGHQWVDGAWTPHDPNGTYQLHPGIGPAGDVYMSILDFAVFAREHLRGLLGSGRLLDQDSYRRIHAPFLPGGQSGLGWGVSTYRGRQASTHSGSAETFLALIVVLPDEGHAFVAVTNAAGGSADAGTRAALSHLVGRFTGARVGT